MNENRVKISNEAIAAWCDKPQSTLKMCTGSGKTKIAIDIIEIAANKIAKEEKRNIKVLIITPTEIIRDKVFPAEFVKWNKSHLMNYCQISCIQSVYEYQHQYYDLVICDEIHNYLYNVGETNYKYYKFFENNKYRYLLGLSASIDDNKLEALNKIAPIVYTLTLDRAVALGIISPFTIYNVKVSLTDEELEEYKKIQKIYGLYESLLGGPYEAFKRSRMYLKKGSTASQEDRTKAIIFNKMIKQRKNLLDNASEKITCTKKILGLFPDSYGIVFSESIEQSGKYVDDNEKALMYHSKMKKSEKTDVIDKINDIKSKYRYISAVKALNEGLSIDSIEFVIITAGNSKVKDMIQRIGRSCRFVEGKEAYVIRLFVEGTQDEKWVRSSQKEFNPKKIRFITQDELWSILKERSVVS